jgi:hypothetical protein
MQNTTNTSNTTNSTPTPVTYVFNVCPIQDLVCGSDTVGPAKAYGDYVNDFANSLNNSAAFVSILGKSGVPITGTPTIIKDQAIPVLNFTAKSPVFYFDLTYGSAWNLTFYNPSQVLCWWSLSTSNTAPTATQIQRQCNATQNSCGMIAVTAAGALIGNTTSTPLAWNTDYYILASCSNNIPYSTNFANVTPVYYFNTGNGPNTPSNNTTNNNNSNGSGNTNNTNTNTGSNSSNTTNKTSGNFISYGFALLMSLLFIF